MKKLLCLMISVILALSTTVIYAAGGETEKSDADLLLLQELNILCTEENETVTMGAEVSKSTFVNCLVNLVANEAYGLAYSSEALKKAENLGIIVSAADVDSSQILTSDEAVVMAVRVLGYEIAAAESVYPYGYYKIARQEGLLSGVSLDGNVTYAQMIELLKNLLGAEHPQIVIRGEGNNLDTRNKQPVLQYYRDIYCVKGLVTANGLTGLYSEGGIRKGHVSIDGAIYKDESRNAAELLGHRVEAYIKSEKSGDDAVVAVVDLAEKELTIDVELVETVSDDCRVIEYYADKNSNKTKKASIAADAAYLLNDILYTDYRKEDFSREGTSIVLLDNNNDGSYDLVRLIYAETMVVSSVSVSSEAVYGEYQFEGALAKLDLSEYVKENIFIYKDGAEVSLSAISAGDVLSVYRAGSGENSKIKILAESNAFNGKVEECNEAEKTVLVNGEEYKFSELYQLALKNNSPMARKMELNVTYTIRLDANGKIVSAATLSDDGVIYGYAAKMAKSASAFDSISKVKMFLTDGTWQIYEFAEKVTWNGESGRLKGSEIASNENILAAVPGVIGVKLNNEGKINVLETPIAYYDGIDPARLNTIGEKRYTYRWNGPTWSNHYYMTGATTVFIIPEEEDALDSDYRIGSATSGFNNWEYTFTGYNRDEYYMLDMIVHKKKVSSIREVTGSYYMVKGVGTSIDENGEIVDSVSVASTTYASVTFQGETGLFDSLESGDLIRLHFDSTGKADNCALVVDANAEKVKRLPNDDERDGSASLVTGFVKKTEPSSGRILLDTVEEMAFKTNPSTSVMVYDGARDRITVEPFGSIEPGDYLAICMSGSGVSQVVVYK